MYYLAGAYVLFLLILIGYLGKLRGRQRELEERLELLKHSLGPENKEG